MRRLLDRLEALLTALYGCPHRRKSFPITIGAETYVVCHDCAARFTYDWSTMRSARRPTPLTHAHRVIAVLLFTAAAAQTQPAQPYQVSVNVNLVLLNAGVQDRRGGFVHGLHEENFAVYEDGIRQAIRLFRDEDLPVTVGLVVDHSGSMRPKLNDVIAAARTFVQLSSPEDEMFVVNFNENVALGLPPGVGFSNRPDELARAISGLAPTGRTALYDAVVSAQVRLQAGHRQRKALLLISDGGDNASAHTQAEVLKVAGQMSTMIYTIGIFDVEDADRNPEVLKRLARSTGGEAYFPRQHGEVVAICERIARDIRHQYTLGYISSNTTRPGAWRTIRVAAQMPGKNRLVVRTRSGYFASGEAAQ